VRTIEHRQMVLPFAAFEAVHSVDRDERQAHKGSTKGISATRVSYERIVSTGHRAPQTTL
jgi:hypothetical protein